MNTNEAMFLTGGEIKTLTGRTRPSAQIRWLRTNGFEVLQRADGMPLVLRSAVVAKMGITSSKRHRVTAEPNWSIFDAA